MQAAALAQELEADQLPLVYWAFATLGYCPIAASLAVLDARAMCISSQLSAQVSSAPCHIMSIALAHQMCRCCLIMEDTGWQPLHICCDRQRCWEKSFVLYPRQI